MKKTLAALLSLILLVSLHIRSIYQLKARGSRKRARSVPSLETRARCMVR